MVEKISHISNPLTIVAVFAGIAEISGTVVLPLLSGNNQTIFMYYVMIFPSLLVLLFFGVLIFKREALYAPKDFVNEENFTKVLNKQFFKGNNMTESTNELIISNDSSLQFNINSDSNG